MKNSGGMIFDKTSITNNANKNNQQFEYIFSFEKSLDKNKNLKLILQFQVDTDDEFPERDLVQNSSFPDGLLFHLDLQNSL